MKHLVIGQRQKAPNFSAFHWSPHGCLTTIGQHFVTTRVVHLPKRTETTLITESDQRRANQQLLQLCTARTAWSDSDQAVRAVHSCKSWFNFFSDIDAEYMRTKFYHTIAVILQIRTHSLTHIENYCIFVRFCLSAGAPVAQWDKHWPTDLAVPSSIPA